MDHVVKAAGSSSSCGSGSGGRFCQKNQTSSTTSSQLDDDEMMSISDLRRGPWTVEEDFTLINYIARHGEGRWNSLARCAGLKRTGKSCRLRWLNYLRPDVRRGNITLEEQLLILELHSRWGNRWSKIAQHLPGRTDNEIKNYWRTRVQKHAKQLKCDVNSKQFKDTMRYLWMPRLVERIQAAAAAGASSTAAAASADYLHRFNNQSNNSNMDDAGSTGQMMMMMMPQPNFSAPNSTNHNNNNYGGGSFSTPDNSSTGAASSDSFATQFSPVSDLTDCYNYPVSNQQQGGNQDRYTTSYQPSNHFPHGDSTALISPTGYLFNQGLDFPVMMDQNNTSTWMDGGDVSDNLWNMEDVLFLQQLGHNI